MKGETFVNIPDAGLKQFQEKESLSFITNRFTFVLSLELIGLESILGVWSPLRGKPLCT